METSMDAERENATDLVRGKLHDIMLPAAPLKTTQLREKLMDLNTDTSKICLEYLDSCQNVRMIDLMTICHILNREQLYILEDEESVVEEDFLRSLESIVSIEE